MRPVRVEAFITAFNEELASLSKVHQHEREARARELAAVTRKLEGLYDAIADGLRSAGLQEKLDRLEAQKAELEQAQATDVPATSVRLHPKLAEIYRSKVARLNESLSAPDVREEAFPLIRELIDRITVTPQGPRRSDSWMFELSGDIVRMVAFGNTSDSGYDKAALQDRTACSVKVVAGARNRLNLLVFASDLPIVSR